MTTPKLKHPTLGRTGEAEATRRARVPVGARTDDSSNPQMLSAYARTSQLDEDSGGFAANEFDDNSLFERDSLALGGAAPPHHWRRPHNRLRHHSLGEAELAPALVHCAANIFVSRGCPHGVR